MTILAADFRTTGQLTRIFCLGLLLQFPSGCSDNTRKEVAEGAAFPLQELELLPLLGDIRPNLHGKTLLVNFWATWCAPCRREMPDLQRLSVAVDPERFAIVGISVDSDANLVREFLLQYQIRFPIYQDADRNLAAGRLGILSYPQTFIVTPEGVITERIDKPLGWDPGRFGSTGSGAGASRSAPAHVESAG